MKASKALKKPPAPPPPAPPRGTKVMLSIGLRESECGHCHRGCDPYELVHRMKIGYDQHEGCGARYTDVQAVYPDTENAVRKMRPDLVFHSLVGIDAAS